MVIIKDKVKERKKKILHFKSRYFIIISFVSVSVFFLFFFRFSFCFVLFFSACFYDGVLSIYPFISTPIRLRWYQTFGNLAAP